MLQTQINNTAQKIDVLHQGNTEWKLKNQILADHTSPHAAVYVFCKKNSGKSNLIANIFLKLCDPDVQLILCQGTQKTDNTTIKLRQILEEKKFKPPIVMNEIVDNKGNNIYQILQNKYDQEIALIEEKKKIEFILNNKEERMKLTKDQIQELEDRLENFPIVFQENKKYDKPMFFVWLDDLDLKQLRAPCIFDMIKKGRHSKAMVVVSGHALKNLDPNTLKQIGVFFVGAKIDQDTLIDLYDRIDLGKYTLQDFISCYADATDQKFQFLQVNVDECLLSKNFREKDYVLEDEDD